MYNIIVRFLTWQRLILSEGKKAKTMDLGCGPGWITKTLCSISEHVVAIDALPLIHKDPFDRLLIAQARVEGITLLTDDTAVAQYQGSVRLA